ncbi:MAG: zinc ribbon domain-containing protein [Promethearchaeota archaeon]
MTLKKYKISRLIIIIFLSGIITLAVFIPNSTDKVNERRSPIIMSSKDHPKCSTEQFLLINDFEMSNYYISPESSPGINDGVFFSFTTNKDGNFTIDVKNYPSELTDTIALERTTAFDNPTGTNLWYLAYLEIDVELEGTSIARYGNFEINLLTSQDKGQKWEKETIAEFMPEGDDFFQIYWDLVGLGLSAYPEKGVIAAASWYNMSDLKFVYSVDNGTTWDSKTITKAANLGLEQILAYWNPTKNGYPRLDVCILKNGTINIVTQANSPNYTPFVYFESHNNGTSWSGPKNVTVSTGMYNYKIKMQVDHQTGYYWLMWMPSNILGDYDIKWAQFNATNGETLYSNVPTDTIYTGKYFNIDFFYDKNNKIFRMIMIKAGSLTYPYKPTEVYNFTCEVFGDPWLNTSLSDHEYLSSLKAGNSDFECVYDGNLFQLFYFGAYTGFTEVYQYYIYENPILWEAKDTFNQYEPKQIYWNGRKDNIYPINISTVKVEFYAQNNTDVLNDTKYITIDNELPYFKEYNQERQYFNPLSSNITLTNINWDLLASEECTSYLEIFKQGSSLSNWQRITDNNLHDQNPTIFRSNIGPLYVLYRSVELGTQVNYLVKSFDNGITWSNPIEIARSNILSGDNVYCGAASGQLVIIFIRNMDTREDLIFRSFDQGETFEDPIVMTDLTINDKVSKLLLTNNGTMFLLHSQYAAKYTVLRSNDLGFNWTTSGYWSNHSDHFSYLYDTAPDMAYDYENDLVHVVLPFMNNSNGMGMQFHVGNYSVATFNMSTNTWREPKGLDTTIPLGDMRKDPKVLVIRDSNKVLKLKMIYIYDQEPIEGRTNYTIKEIVSVDLGETWSGPTLVTETNNATTFTSSNYDIFYVIQKSDANDYEIYFSREGSLIRTKKESLPPTSTQITFDGIDDFGEYISEGNYSYNLFLRDDAGNEIRLNGFFYADYNGPQITDRSTSLSSPIPRYDLTITVKITDSIDFTSYLYYSKDSGNWQKILMENISIDYFSATIPGDTTTDEIQYYVRAVDLAGNEFELDNDDKYYSYSMPSFVWSSEGLFKETKEYSSSNIYTFTITISEDLEYVSEVIFRYSYDEGDSWDDLELEQSSPEFEGELDDIPGDLRELYYKIIIIDIYENEYELTGTQKIEFYPDVPSVEIDEIGIFFLIVISSVIGFVVAFGYIRLKKVSHEVIYQKILTKELLKRTGKSRKLVDKKPNNKNINFDREESALNFAPIKKNKIATPFTMTYLGVLCGTILIFSIGMLISYITPEVTLLILAGSLLLAVYGYMILMSRDITINIYLEKIYKRNIILEVFQMSFMLINIVMILIVGYTMDWFRYYLVESTFDFGDLSIPRLYLSVIAVFFTSLVLVIFTTYIQLRKTVHNILKQRNQGATENLLLYLKDQNSSRLITHTGYKTIVFLVTILVAIVSTTNLLTNENGILLIVILIPFVIAGFSALITHRLIEREKRKKEKEEMQMLFVDSKKICTKCGEPIYLSNRFCSSCGEQQIFADMIGTYISRCTECTAPINDKAKFCTDCGRKI